MKNKLVSYLTKNFTSELFTYDQVLKMLYPLILDMFFISAISMLTTSMISSSSPESVAAVSLINPITTLLVVVVNAVAGGGTIVVAQYKGRNDNGRILEASGHTISITTITAILLNSIVIICSPIIVSCLFQNISQAVLDKSIIYLIGGSISSIILSVFTSIFSVYRGLGETQICLYLTIFINFTYLLLSLLFINVFEWDILGIVLALNIARLAGTIIAIYSLFYKKNKLIAINKKHILHFNKTYLKSIFKISIPFGAEQCFFCGGTIIGQIIIADFGTQNIVSYAIAASILGVITSAPMAVGTLATTVIGQCIGAERRTLARWYGGKLLHLGTCLSIISILIFLPLQQFIIQLYQPASESVPMIIELLLISIIPMPFVWSMSNVMPHILRSAGDATFSSVTSLVTMWVVRIGIGYLLAINFELGIYGICIGTSFEWIVRFFIFNYRYKGTKWLTKKTISD